MLDDDKVDQSTPTETPAQSAEHAVPDTGAGDPPPVKKAAAKKATKKAPAKRTTKKVAAPPAADPATEPAAAAVEAPLAETAAPVVRTTTRRRTTKKVASAPPAEEAAPEPTASAEAVDPAADSDLAAAAPVRKAAARKTTRKAPARKAAAPAATDESTPDETTDAPADAAADAATAAASVLFQAPEPTRAPARRTRKAAAPKAEAPAPSAEAPAPSEDEEEAATAESEVVAEPAAQPTPQADEASEASEDETDEGEGEGGPARRRRRRGGRRRRKPGDGGSDANGGADDEDEPAEGEPEETPADDASESGGEGTSRRRRRRRRTGEEGTDGDDDANTVTRVRSRRSAEDQITAVAGSTRLEAKKQRRREGREAGRRRAPIVSEAEFLARRESVDRVMVIRQREDLTQIAVLEDKVLVEHYVARESQTSLIGNVYLGRVQNVLPSMEAAFIDIGKGRNAVLYAGEVNWSALGHKDGQPRKIESVLSSGQSVLVQVTKDPVGHKGARLTSQISLAGRFLVYVPDGTTSGISRKLPDTERNRLKSLLKEIVPDTAGVIVRTAAEGASEDELTRDVERLKARWEDIEAKSRGNAPQLLYGEPDLTLKVVRDLFTEDFTRMVIEGDDAWDTVQGYVTHVAPDLEDRLERFERGDNGKDAFGAYRIDEQIQKGLDRKVWLPSGGSLVIDRTEAMTVVDVNTGKFTGSGGNLEETVTKNNLEAAEEIVRQLRLRDIGGIIVVDFIDMVLESNRDLVVRRLVECLGRDRTRHQVAEVTSLGLVQMTRKRIGTGLLEAFSTDCEHCHGRGVVISDSPVEPGKQDEDGRRGGGRRNRGRGKGDGADSGGDANGNQGGPSAPSPKDVAAMARAEGERKVPEADSDSTDGEAPAETTGGRNRRSGRGRGGSRGAAAATTDEVATTPTEDRPTEDRPTEDRPAEPAAAPEESGPAAEPEPTTEPEVEPTEDVTEAPTGPDSMALPAMAAAPTLSADADTDADAAVEGDKPRVVTRTRRRSASRPAGPPTGIAGARPDTGLVEPGTAGLEPGAEAAAVLSPDHHVEHVPIKKKGTRKR